MIIKNNIKESTANLALGSGAYDFKGKEKR
jgi:hypothetical protein